MRTKQFDYHLPKELIAQKPIRPRDHSRLLVVERRTGTISHQRFYRIINYLEKGDVLVLNNSKVIPARLWGKRMGTGGKIEAFLLNKISSNTWEVLLGGKRRRIGLEIKFSQRLSGKIFEKKGDTWLIRFNLKGPSLLGEVYRLGETPTPPYIKAKSNLREYQTTYAKKGGSVAAPTAGFHFTQSLMNRLKKKGIQFEFVTLHVGLGTFQPVKTEKIEDHKMHPEFVSVDKKTAYRLNQAKKEGRRIIAVGTTTIRTLESLANKQGRIRPHQGWINIFIYPGYHFRFVGAIITNFHLPKSTLIMLIAAFVNLSQIKKAYQEAIKKKYRFYSFGDAMLIL